MVARTIMVRRMYRDSMSDVRNVANHFEEILLEVVLRFKKD